jgi:hypothetical protein
MKGWKRLAVAAATVIVLLLAFISLILPGMIRTRGGSAVP